MATQTRTRPRPFKERRSLSAFVADKKRERCPVCALPLEVRDQIKGATDRKIRRAVVLEWLRVEHGVKLTDADLNTHYTQRHAANEE